MKLTHPPGFPYEWCESWGEDNFGIWLEFDIKNITLRMRWIKPGTFLMGSPEEEPYRNHNENQREVTVSKGFWFADTACSQELWQIIMENNPSYCKGSRKPVENVSWNDCKEFLDKINIYLKNLALSFPSEEQWEYTCRAGTTTSFSFGINITPDLVNYNGKYPYLGNENGLNREETVEIKSLPPNQWGMYEMHGNVWEWCVDLFGKYNTDIMVEGIQTTENQYRVLRGGSAYSNATNCRSAARSKFHFSDRYNRNGFRFMWNPEESQKKNIQLAEEKQKWNDEKADENRVSSDGKVRITVQKLCD